MGKKPKRKLTKAEKARKRQRKAEFMTVFLNGKQKQVRRPQTIDGMDVDDFIRANADPVWLHQNGLWEYMEPLEEEKPRAEEVGEAERIEEPMLSAEIERTDEEYDHEADLAAGDWGGDDDVPF